MKKTIGGIFAFMLAATVTQAQNPQDITAIKSMCGCYEVDFQFGETFSPDKNYKFYENEHSKGLEWVQLLEDTKGKIVLQHLLVVSDSATGQKDIVKHWRQDWLYQNKNVLAYDRDNSWNNKTYSDKDVKGQWTQKVFQVDDSPRYEATATWIHADGKHYWESTTDSPLPRREHTIRNDYNVLRRTNRHEITAYGWIHDQDNDKINRSEAGDRLIAQEKGLNTYKKVENSRCEAAQKWWKENEKFWAAVRKEWDVVLSKNQGLKMEAAVDNKPLYRHLAKLKPDQTTEIKPIIEKFVKK